MKRTMHPSQLALGLPGDALPPQDVPKPLPPDPAAGLGIDWSAEDEVNEMLRGETSDLFLIRRNRKRREADRTSRLAAAEVLFNERCEQDAARIRSFKGTGTPFDPHTDPLCS